MQQGARGEWLFHLTFSPEPHDGAFIYTFYLGLGHLASVLSLPLPIVYHLGRVAAGLFLLLVAYRFITRFFDRIQTRRTAFLLLGLSAGFGWLLAPLGIVTSADLWVTEGLVFLSILTNPHFPLAIGLMLLIAMTVLDAPCAQGDGGWQRLLPRLAAAGGLGLILAVIQPFVLPIVAVVLATYLGLLALHQHRWPWPRILVSGSAIAGSAPVMLYDLYVYRSNPALAAWSAQNLTPSLPPWDYALGYGLVLLLALVGIGVALRRRRETDLFLLAWLGSAVILLYVPFALQRRFITGLHVPLVLLATLALEHRIWPRIAIRRRGLATGLLIGLTALTNLFVPLVSVIGVAQGQHQLVMSQAEYAAYTWLGDNTAWTDTVLAPVEVSQFVPAWAGNRVVYGHPFETIEAKSKELEVRHFYSAQATAAERRALLDRYGVRYVLTLSAEDAQAMADPALIPAWSQGPVRLYRVELGP
jgi:hypothetical protein